MKALFSVLLLGFAGAAIVILAANATGASPAEFLLVICGLAGTGRLVTAGKIVKHANRRSRYRGGQLRRWFTAPYRGYSQ